MSSAVCVLQQAWPRAISEGSVLVLNGVGARRNGSTRLTSWFLHGFFMLRLLRSWHITGFRVTLYNTGCICSDRALESLNMIKPSQPIVYNFHANFPMFVLFQVIAIPDRSRLSLLITCRPALQRNHVQPCPTMSNHAAMAFTSSPDIQRLRATPSAEFCRWCFGYSTMIRTLHIS